MSGTAPEPLDASRTPVGPPTPDDDRQGMPPARPRSRWWLVVVVVAALAVVLVWRPWDGGEPAPVPTPEPTPEVTPTPTPEPSRTPTASAAPAPGADAIFDPATAGSLFATSADLERDVPGAAAGVARGLEPGTRPWGLPEGASIDPASCTTAVTVVSAPPSFHDATSWVNEDLTFEQDVVVLLDPAAARAAFRALVTTVDECPRYTLDVPGAGGTRWTAEPALEGQGVFPAIVHDLTAQVDDDTYQQTTGHVLVGNAILTWTATALDASDRQDARAVLGDPAQLSEMVERRALAAVRGLP
ncbi:sensor domain-containing protein [Cellulomonas dongxiuzhuiae]|uniref:Sensor domain-containing protein n=1 Tax=Cellulomonas dongxiuzhuiae TaxID=2819979 RepID=A0ABX8GM34_9CELL|nr:sensor domain-containing protein [Cellulomonas dongxiuzhuiae]MBO3087831.1 sensor domain-containing protein [Cellulomonas dongxiuzhuiae]MBO3095788.1 sensor domain-containing protein [Cellulomonas dongxiuzhuiae]QWC17100.1 sensor domain-containing protein [Cellulomonas dongxiuzhuiae]